MPEAAALTAWLRAGLLLMGAAGAAGLLWRFLRWRQGRHAPVPWWSGLAAVPRRYLVDVHDVVVREPVSARMHAMAAGGLLATLLVFAVELGTGRSDLTRMAGLAAGGVFLAGVVQVFWRRRAAPERRRSRGEWRRLGASLAALCVGLLLWFADGTGDGHASALQALAALLVLAGSAEVLVGAGWGGPMRHALTGALNLAWHPRPGRFAPRSRDVGLQLADLTQPTLGLRAPRDWTWTRILNVDACVQCGRCEAACPAFAAGQPLNPKAFVHDLLRACGTSPLTGRYTGSPHPGLQAEAAPAPTGGDIAPQFVAPATLWSCTTCRACVHECPMMIEHVDAMVELRRHRSLEVGDLPGKAPKLIELLRATDNSAGEPPAARLAWAGDLRLRVLRPGESADLLWWVGDAGFDPRSRRTLRALAQLLQEAGVDVALLGPGELDCGDTARRLGEEAVFQDLARRNVEMLASRRFQRILTSDPHVMNSLRNDYPALGGHYRVVHHTELLAELLDAGRLTVRTRLTEALTYHDPCYLARWNGEVEAARRVLDRIAPRRIEMQRSGTRARCCGGGGGAPLTDVPGERRIADMRMGDVRESGAALVAVACPNCMTMLEGSAGPRAEVADVAELLLRACAGDGAGKS